MKRSHLYLSIYNFINTYSVFVAVGSLSSYLFFSELLDIKPNYIVATGLSIGLWVIYTFDHLLDGLRLGDKASSTRHREHFLKHKQITRLVIIGLASLIGLSFWVPFIYYNYIVFLCILTLIHFLINYNLSIRFVVLRYFKEVFIAFVVTIGFVITPVLELHSSIDMNQLIYVFMLFYFINLSNLLIFSYFDNELDKKDNITTIVHFFGLAKLRGLIYSGIALSFIILTISYMNEEINEVSFYVFLSMQVTLIGIIIFPSFFGTNERYRFFGDLIYLYPIAIFPFLC